MKQSYFLNIHNMDACWRSCIVGKIIQNSALVPHDKENRRTILKGRTFQASSVLQFKSMDMTMLDFSSSKFLDYCKVLLNILVEAALGYTVPTRLAVQTSTCHC